jgi:undecaprenyl-diphosphatase
MFIMIVIATLPLFLVLPIRKQLESLYYQNVFIGVAIILTGCMLYVADKMLPGKKTERTMTLSDALIIGLCQCVATIPGLSRSGTTITAGIATGLRREYAVKFSFLMSIPAVLGANILSFADAIKAGIDWAYVPAYLVCMVLALLSGIASIHFIRYISAKAKFGGFAYYCWVVGVLAIVMSLIF